MQDAVSKLFNKLILWQTHSVLCSVEYSYSAHILKQIQYTITMSDLSVTY